MTVPAAALGLVAAVAAIVRWRMVGLAFAVLASGLLAIGGGVRAALVGSGTERRFVGEVVTDAGVALVTGAALGLVLLGAQDAVEEGRFRREQELEDERTEREQRRDNIRFVREVATQPDAVSKPFDGLDLRCADLQGLDLSGATFTGADLSDADLSGADLTGADLNNWIEYAPREGLRGSQAFQFNSGGSTTDLSGASLVGANLTDADLFGADLTGAQLVGAAIVHTWLVEADLRGADLSQVDLSTAVLFGADLTDVIYDDTTRWPPGFEPPPSAGASPLIMGEETRTDTTCGRSGEGSERSGAGR